MSSKHTNLCRSNKITLYSCWGYAPDPVEILPVSQAQRRRIFMPNAIAASPPPHCNKFRICPCLFHTFYKSRSRWQRVSYIQSLTAEQNRKRTAKVSVKVLSVGHREGRGEIKITQSRNAYAINENGSKHVICNNLLCIFECEPIKGKRRVLIHNNRIFLH